MDEPEDITTTYSWSVTGLLTSSTDGNQNATGYDYDDRGNLTATNFPIGSEHSRYDGIGNMAFSVTPNGDTFNEFFTVMGMGLQTYQLRLKIPLYITHCRSNILFLQWFL